MNNFAGLDGHSPVVLKCPQHQKLPSVKPYSIASSARASNCGGTVPPSEDHDGALDLRRGTRLNVAETQHGQNAFCPRDRRCARAVHHSNRKAHHG